MAQRRSIEDAPPRRVRVMGVSRDASQVSLPASTVPASSTAVREVCEYPSRVDFEEFLSGFDEDLMAPVLYQSAPHSVQDMDEQQFSVTRTTVHSVPGELRRKRRGDSDQEKRARRGNKFAVLSERHSEEDVKRVKRSAITSILVQTLSTLTEWKLARWLKQLR